MKICLISFDYWGYNQHIVDALQTLGHEAYHLDASKFEFYTSTLHRFKCGLTKIFKRKNLKKEAFQNLPIEYLQKHGPFDQILVIRADLYSVETHEKIRAQCKTYIAYHYDSAKRFQIDTRLTSEIFDKIYSYDPIDAKEQGWEYITNYIYLDKKEPRSKTKYDCAIVMSSDERLTALNRIAERLKALNLKTKFIVVGKKTPKGMHPSIELATQDVPQQNTLKYLEDSRVIVDLVRKDHFGLSFRIFEALAMQKKIITSNSSIKDLEFYNPQNIFVMSKNIDDIPVSFFKSAYQTIDESIYQKFTVSSWVKTVFSL